MSAAKTERILITGIAGSLAQLVARRLHAEGHEVTGVDYRPVRALLPAEIKTFQANYNKTKIEDVFKRIHPERVLHLGRVGNLKTTAVKRFDLNVVGSAKIMELSVKHDVKRLVVMSTFHIYGADPANHIPISEEEPLRAGQSFPQLADAVQLDNMASTWLYRHRKLRTVVLRPTNIVGANIKNAISTFLRGDTLVYLLGYSPMWQFVHETDMVEALSLALWSDVVGVYNVCGNGEIPIIEALTRIRDLSGARLLPLPGPVAELILRLGSTLSASLPPYFLDFLRYHCVLTDARFRKDFGYIPKVGLSETLRTTVVG